MLIPSRHQQPYTLPLDVGSFRRAVKVGHGRARQHLAEHGASGVEDALVHACLHNLAYDAQVEGDRGGWMLDLIDVANARDVVLPAVVESVHGPTDSLNRDWDLSQRCTVMAALAKRGDDEARRALFRIFRAQQSTLIGALDIMELDGEQGLLHVCSTFGARAKEQAKDWIDDWFLGTYDEWHGDGAALRTLGSSSDDGVRVFLERRAGALPKEPRGRSSLAEQAPDEIVDWIKMTPMQDVAGGGGLWLGTWGVRASGESLDVIIDALEVADDPLELQRFLRVFSRRAMPAVSERTIRLTEHPHAGVRARAYDALSNVSDPRVREAGLRSLDREPVLNGSLALFESSYRPGDHVAITEALFVPQADDELHGIVADLRGISRSVDDPDALELMLFVYEHSPCGDCRSHVVDDMIALGVLPDWVGEECRFDAMEEIRDRLDG